MGKRLLVKKTLNVTLLQELRTTHVRSHRVFYARALVECWSAACTFAPPPEHAQIEIRVDALPESLGLVVAAEQAGV